MATQGHIGELDPTVPGKCDSYVTWLEFFLTAKKVTNFKLKQTMLFSVCVDLSCLRLSRLYGPWLS